MDVSRFIVLFGFEVGPAVFSSETPFASRQFVVESPLRLRPSSSHGSRAIDGRFTALFSCATSSRDRRPRLPNVGFRLPDVPRRGGGGGGTEGTAVAALAAVSGSRGPQGRGGLELEMTRGFVFARQASEASRIHGRLFLR